MDTYPIFQTPKEIESRFHSSADIVLYHGDALQFVSTIPDNTISLIITSPPYNLGKKYENQVSISKYLETQEEIISQLYRILRQDGSLCWQVGNYVENGEVYPLDILYYQIFKNLGMYLRNRIIWYFGHGLHASKRFSGRYETLLWFSKSDHYVFNLDAVRIPSKYPGKRYYKGPNIGKLSGNPYGKNPSDVWEFIAKEWDEALWNIPNVKSNHPEKTIHPCQYPIELVERCVLALTKKNDWVYDPYAGVGSALLAALIHGRKAAGSEKEQEYVKIARDRIRDYYNGTLKIRPVGRPVHEPTGKEKIVQFPQEWSELFNTGADL